jgi:hypothetical protein
MVVATDRQDDPWPARQSVSDEPGRSGVTSRSTRAETWTAWSARVAGTFARL